jgi:hypothetical protein
MVTWKNFRLRLIKERHPLRCRLCGDWKKVQLHHVLPVSIRPDLECERSNIVELCKLHHFIIGHLSNWTNYNVHFWEDFHALKNTKYSNIK